MISFQTHDDLLESWSSILIALFYANCRQTCHALIWTQGVGYGIPPISRHEGMTIYVFLKQIYVLI